MVGRQPWLTWSKGPDLHRLRLNRPFLPALCYPSQKWCLVTVSSRILPAYKAGLQDQSLRGKWRCGIGFEPMTSVLETEVFPTKLTEQFFPADRPILDRE